MMRADQLCKFLSVVLAASLAVGSTSCKSGKDAGAVENTRPEPEAQSTPQATPAKTKLEPDESDLNWFLKELRSAANSQDMYRLAALMTPNFGYQLNPPLEGDGVFQYWDENNMWGELALIVNDEFVPNGDFMVAPPEFADPAILYTGYRAGIIQIAGKWRFAYFVRD